MPAIHRQGVSIVLIGSFNPAICHPSWFAGHDLLRREEADAATITIVHPDASVFKTEWLQVSVVRDRFQVSTIQESYYELLRDMVVGTLGLLSHTPITAMGVNRDFHFDLGTERAWHGVGHRLVPKDEWSPLLRKPGMRRLEVEGLRVDGLGGYLRVIVAPSVLLTYGLFVEVNDHYEFKAEEKGTGGAGSAAVILSQRWNDSMERGVGIAEAIATLGEKNELK